MKRLIALIICLLFTVACAEGAYTGPEGSDFTLEKYDGTVFTLSEAFRDHDLVIVNVWATWCPWCIKEFPILEQVWAEYSDRVDLICVSWYDSNEEIAVFAADNGINLPLAYDSVDLTHQIVYEGLPTTVAINSNGEIVLYTCGALMEPDNMRGFFDVALENAGISHDNVIAVTDESGAPVPGAVISVCNDSMCVPFTADENGIVTFPGDEHPYTVHVIKAPAGYIVNPSNEYIMTERSLAVTVEKAS